MNSERGGVTGKVLVIGADRRRAAGPTLLLIIMYMNLKTTETN